MGLPPRLHLGGHGGVELGEALAQAGLGGHALGHAPADAARLAARERLGGEVVDARVEAVVDEVAEDLGTGEIGSVVGSKIGNGKSGKRRTFINSLTWRFCRRVSSSRCSACVRLSEGGVSICIGGCCWGEVNATGVVPSVHCSGWLWREGAGGRW